MKNYNLSPKQQGISIVELLVALAVGMVLIAGIMQVFLASKNTYAVNQAMSTVQENGRFALEFIARSARQAGYVDPNNKVSRPFAVIPEAAKCSLASKACSQNGDALKSDIVSFAFQPPINQTGARVDCIGDTKDVDTNDKIVINRFLITGEDTDQATLSCQRRVLNKNLALIDTAGNFEEAALVEGIDKIQIQYGVSTSGDSYSVNKYVNADKVDKWDEVLAVRIGVIANSGSDLNPAPVAKEFYLFDTGPYTFPNDRKLRQVFTTTVHIRNRK
ncbi:MAG: hypothetical protein GXZ10_12315 [Gammaproteobacteria bacterium]|nr:hypothetical protein [Gammaproteobacteria bacterium]